MEHIRTFNESSNPGLKKGQFVKYKMDGYNDELSQKEQEDKIGHKKIDRVEGDTVYFKDKDGQSFLKTKDEILPNDEKSLPEKEDPIDELKDHLGKIKSDPDKIRKVLDYVTFIEKEK